MPLLTGTMTAPPPPPTPPPSAGWPPMVSDVGTITASWIDPEGTVWPLSDRSDERGWFTTPGPSGWGATQYELVADPLSRGGELLRFVRAQPARLTWPLHIFGETNVGFRDRWRALKRAFTMTVHRRAPGTLRVRYGDGDGREIDCYYEDGFGGQPGENWTYANPVLTLYAPDGYWRAVDPLRVVRQQSTGVPFLDPYPTVSRGSVLGETVIDNPGDVVAWPTWTIVGPASQIEATNSTTGDAFTLTTAIDTGEVVTITTERPTVRDNAGANIVSALNWPSAVLWGLLPGSNEIDFTVTGAADGTRIELEFYARYEGA